MAILAPRQPAARRCRHYSPLPPTARRPAASGPPRSAGRRRDLDSTPPHLPQCHNSNHVHAQSLQLRRLASSSPAARHLKSARAVTWTRRQGAQQRVWPPLQLARGASHHRNSSRSRSPPTSCSMQPQQQQQRRWQPRQERRRRGRGLPLLAACRAAPCPCCRHTIRFACSPHVSAAGGMECAAAAWPPRPYPARLAVCTTARPPGCLPACLPACLSMCLPLWLAAHCPRLPAGRPARPPACP